MRFIKRIYYHSMRFRGEFLFASIFSAIVFLFFGGLYPEEGISEFVDVFQKIGLLGHLSNKATGWSIWMSFIVGLILYAMVAITSINIGSRIIPTQEEDGSEFFMGSNPMNPRLFYLENILSGVLVVVAVMLPSIVIVTIQTYLHDAMDIIGKILLAFLAYIAIALFFIAITSAVTTSMFQRGLARGFGYGYVFYSMIMEIFADNPNADLQDAAKLSVNYYAGIISLITNESYEWNPILVILGISAFFMLFGFIFVKYPHYIEKATSKERFSIVEATTGFFVKPHSRFSQRFPLISEQLRKDQKAMFILLLIFTIYFPVLLGSFNSIGDELATLAASFNTPSTAILIQGNTLDASILSYGILKFYANAWMWFGIYSLLVAASLPTREVRTKSQDIIFGTQVKPGKLVDHRVIAMLIEFTILLWYGFFLTIIISYSFGDVFIDDYATADIQFNYFFNTWILYSAIFITITTVAMIPKEVSKGRRYGIAFFVISLLLSWIAYADDSVRSIRYLSMFDYYEPVPILYGDVSFFDALLNTVIILLLSVIFYIFVRKYRYENTNLY